MIITILQSISPILSFQGINTKNGGLCGNNHFTVNVNSYRISFCIRTLGQFFRFSHNDILTTIHKVLRGRYLLVSVSLTLGYRQRIAGRTSSKGIIACKGGRNNGCTFSPGQSNFTGFIYGSNCCIG